MLAARRTARRASQLARSYASIVETSGVKVAAVDNGQPTSSVTFLFKAGSRYETKPGVAHALKNFAFKATSSRSALGTIREAELYGGVLSSSLTREHLAYTAEFLRGDEAFFVDVLTSLVTSSKFTPWELSESVLPVVEAETHAASSDSKAVALELAHALAFRSGLGNSVIAPSHPSISVDDVKQFASSAFSAGNFTVLGTGITASSLTKLLEKRLGSSTSSGSVTSPVSKYFGGETRHALHGAPQTVFVGFGTAGSPSAELATLAAHLSTKPSIKWSQGTSPLSATIPSGTSVDVVYLPYSDASLFGFLVQGTTPEGVREASQAAVKALKASGSIAPEGVKRAASKAKFAAASAVEGRDGFISTLGPQILAGSPSLEAVHASLDKVDSSSISSATASLFKSTPTFIAVGDINSLPYKDEIGL